MRNQTFGSCEAHNNKKKKQKKLVTMNFFKPSKKQEA
jgi:hypothetical protein